MRESVLMTIFLFAWILCGCAMETVIDNPSGAVVFVLAMVVCVVVAIVIDRSDL